MKIELYYDKECPFCKSYANYIKLKKMHELTLLNARENINAIKKFRNQGFDIDEGFIVKVDDNKIYQGSNAIVFLNTIAEKKIYFKDNLFFKNFIYPFAKALRKVLLFFLGKKTKI
eukprot:TRINITY_DN41123_c1_g1_i1.p1 TRINITY_DN41123_c1_g1~~TRINITY_DN41123_c1_g1_i1.p1  ORF type:complete len:116 (+),score=0.24 TRINITY_DN41123_c1_g1_i1:563-910(+)